MKTVSGLKLFVGTVVVLVCAVIVVGLFLAGSPGKERDRRFDQQRVNELQQISYAVDSYYDRNAVLPETLEDLRVGAAKQDYYLPSLVDPRSGAPYEYLPETGTDSYRLCATFDLPSEEETGDPRIARPMMPEPYPANYRTWIHPAGYHCFPLVVEPRQPVVVCSLTSPCQAGQTCASLPGRRGTVCVPQGKECEAAGCPGACTIAESYPVQVRCPNDAPPPANGDEPVSSGDCSLWREKSSGRVDCFGCAGRVCKDPALIDWEPYERPEGEIGIPYSCYATQEGCQLAQ